MKKILSFVAVAFCAVTMLSAQVLQSQGVENTLSTAFGTPHHYVYKVGGTGTQETFDSFHFYGFYETLQARIDIKNFTIEGMVNWGALTATAGSSNAVSSFNFLNTDQTPFTCTNSWFQGGERSNGLTDSHYVNFIARTKEGLQFGIGTRLGWSVGPAPAWGGLLWQPTAHLVQGGLKQANPGAADVAGYMDYANCYARTAIAARYINKMFEFGFALPSGSTTDAFNTNFAVKFTPVSNVAIGAALEARWGRESNLYTGATIGFTKNLVLDAWVAVDNIGGVANNVIWGTGGALTIVVLDGNLRIRPETSFSFYGNVNYTMAWYVGASIEAKINAFTLGAWSSVAWGAANNEWYNDKLPTYSTTKDWRGGFVFDIRPYATYQINKNHSISAMVDIQNRTTFDNRNSTGWATAIYWTYRKPF